MLLRVPVFECGLLYAASRVIAPLPGYLPGCMCMFRKDDNGNMKDSLSPPWFYKESPEFYTWLRNT